MAIKRPSIEYDRKVLGSIPTVSIFFLMIEDELI